MYQQPAVWHYSTEARTTILAVPSPRLLDNPELTPLAIKRAAREAIDTGCDGRND